MRRSAREMRRTMVVLLGIFVVARGMEARGQSPGAEISGVVRMPEICSPSVSPAVIYLEPASGSASTVAGSDASGASAVVLVNQKGLQFAPRVQAVQVGRTVRFTNQDTETHNVHIVSPGFAFNQSMSPGNTQDFTPEKPGVVVLACDVHIHMKGYVVVCPTPWYSVCSAKGRFRIDGVPDGRYILNAWHEMGEPLRQEIAVVGGQPVDFPELVLSGPKARVGSVAAAPVRPWAEVVDRIGMLLTASRQAATRKGQVKAARRFAEDAYWAEFEASDMEVAVRRHLGFARAGELELGFRRFQTDVRAVAEGRTPASKLEERSHDLLLDLLAAARELIDRGIPDAAHDHPTRNDVAEELPTRVNLTDLGGVSGDPSELLQNLRRGFHRIAEVADRDGADEASSELTSIYMTDFEPIERYLLGRSPQSVRPLEITFNAIRGEIGQGLKGQPLTDRLDKLNGEVDALIARLEARPAGAFGTAFLESFVTIVREGVEVILVLAMLIALVARAGEPSAESRAQAMRAIWTGVGLALVASLLTAAGLNLLVATAQGRAREVVEGAVMLAAAGVLFYVSYWLVSQSQAKRWMDFLKRNANKGLQWGGGGTLAITAFLAVYREGAETSLMYQAMLGSQGTTRAGLLGLGTGLLLGLAVLAVVAVAVRATSVRLPMATFFKVSGGCLFALAVIFAGNGVFALQTAGILLTTPLHWLGNGLPIAGLYPNVQVVSVQGLLLAGAALSWAVIPRASVASRKEAPAPGSPIPA